MPIKLQAYEVLKTPPAPRVDRASTGNHPSPQGATPQEGGHDVQHPTAKKRNFPTRRLPPSGATVYSKTVGKSSKWSENPGNLTSLHLSGAPLAGLLPVVM